MRLLLAAVFLCTLPGPRAGAMPLYGEDNRQDLYQVQAPDILGLADSTVALFELKNVSLRGDRAVLKTESYAKAHNLCKTEPFYEQNIGAFCSGALVGPDLILTAGHCVKSQVGCSKIKIVFGFSLRQAGQPLDSVAASEVYSCKSIEGRRLKKNGKDWALIRLDRPVRGHAPLSIDPADAAVGDPLLTIGHPNGLPAKVADGAVVLDDKSAHYFKADLDTYHSNSGSPVFSARTGKIVGILASGEDDFEVSAQEDFRAFGTCNKSRVCKPGKCEGERVTKASVFAEALRQSPPPPSIAASVRETQAFRSLQQLADQ